jgi:hypothetical protein
MQGSANVGKSAFISSLLRMCFPFSDVLNCTITEFIYEYWQEIQIYAPLGMRPYLMLWQRVVFPLL